MVQIKIVEDAVFFVPELFLNGSVGFLGPLRELRCRLADHIPDNDQILVGPAQEGIDEGVLYLERALGIDLVFVIVEFSEQINEPHVSVIVDIRRSLFSRDTFGQIPSLIAWQSSFINDDGLQRPLPDRGVIHARLPRMAHINQPFMFGIPVAIKIFM